MTSPWVALPQPPLLVSGADPYVVVTAQANELERYFLARNANFLQTDVAAADRESAVVTALKSVLSFPDWCGSGWDSMEDAFEELRQAWAFPLVLLMTGLPTLMATNPQLALQTVVRMSDFIRAFSASGDQLIVVYQW